MRNNHFILNMYDKKKFSSKLVSQLIYGDTFKIIEKYSNWLKIKNNEDNYIGYIKKRKFKSYLAPTHKINKTFAYLYKKPNKVSKIKQKISFASKVKIIKKKKTFANLIIIGLKKKI